MNYINITFKRSVTVMLSFVLVFFTIFSCDDDLTPIKPDTRLDGKDGIEIVPINPITGVAYTEEELSELDYDPTTEDFFTASQDVIVNIWTQIKPLRIEIEKEGGNAIIATIDSFTESNNGFVATWTTSVGDLEILEGGGVRYLFYVVYDDENVDGFAFASEQSVSFKINHVSAGANALAFYQTGLGMKEIVGFSGPINGLGNDGRFGTYAEFNGATNLAILSESEYNLDFTHSQDFSVSLWVNTTATNSDPSIIGDKDWGSGGNKGFVLAFRGSDWKANVGDGSGNRADANGGVINDGQWHHLTVTFERSGDMTLYQDGAQISSTSMAAVGDMNSGMPITLAQDGTGSYGDWFGGQIGGVVVSDYVLSPGEVEIMALKQNVQLRKADGVTLLPTTISGTSAIDYEEGQLVNVYGDADYATINDGGELDITHAGDFTIAMWVNTVATNSDPSIIGDKNWGSGGNKGFVLAFLGGNWKVNVGDGTGNRADASSSGPNINDGLWHFLAATFDRDGNMVLYQDGVEVGNTNMAAVGDMNSGMPVRIAQDGTGAYGDNFAGKVGNTYIYDKALTAQEISALFTE